MKIVKRSCRGCKNIKDREEMFKITLNKGALYLNPSSKITGRSAYVCKNESCIKNLIKTKGIKRALKFNNEAEIKKIETNLLKEFDTNARQIQRG